MAFCPSSGSVTAVAGFLERLVTGLDSSGVPHMLAGSFASTYYGVPRTTQDIDIVVEFTLPTLRRFLSQLPDDKYYVSLEAAETAVRTRGQFNVIDFESGWKVDLIQRKARAFSKTEFDRRVPAELFGVALRIATAEDVVLSKLEWATKSASERQLRDVAGVIEVSGASLDIPYVERWAEALGVAELWAELRARHG